MILNLLVDLVERIYNRCWHKYEYTTATFRICQKCGREEIYAGEIRTGDGYWYEIKQYRRLFLK